MGNGRRSCEETAFLIIRTYHRFIYRIMIFSFLIGINPLSLTLIPSPLKFLDQKKKKIALSCLIFLRHGPLSFVYCNSAARSAVNYFIRTEIALTQELYCCTIAAT